MKKPELWIGARGWRHASWVGDFYPDDIPREWWLAYYSNEFEAVLVPWGYLQEADTDILQAWLDDTSDNFGFFIELPLSASKTHVEMVLNTLGPRLRGILLDDINGSSEVAADVIPAPVWLESAKNRAPIAVNWNAVTPNSDLTAQRYQLGCYWWPEQHDLNECGGSLGIAELDSNSSHDPKSLKNLLEHCRSVQGPTTIGLFFAGDSPSIDEMRNALMILQMLG